LRKRRAANNWSTLFRLKWLVEPPMNRATFLLIPLLAFALPIAACHAGSAPGDDAGDEGTASAPPPAATAAAVLKPASGSQVSGTVSFSEVKDGVRVVADVSGLAPGKHGFHVHEKGDCSDPEAKSAGGHFNPSNTEHGAPDAAKHHAGDLGNLTADAGGHATLDTVFKDLVLTGPDSIVGKGLIVHGGEDDLKSQPVGNAGSRVACGMIGAGAP
jgi:Cu-Zn family superoxide dismutase